MKIEIEVPDKRMIDLLIEGIEGGIAYWCKSANRGEGNSWIFVEREGNVEHRVSAPMARYALVLMHQKAPEHFADWLTGCDDATTGDALIQLACFGELKYS